MPLPWPLLGSLALHSLVLALLLLDVWPRQDGDQPLPPPAIEMVFDTGQPEPQASGAPEGETPDAVEPPARAEAPPPAPEAPSTSQPPSPPPSPPLVPQLAMPLPPLPPAQVPPPPIPPPPSPEPPRAAPPPPAPPRAETPQPPAAPLPPPLPALAELPPRPPEPVPRLSAEIPPPETPPEWLAQPTPPPITAPRLPIPPPAQPRPTPPPRPTQQAQPSPRLPGMVLPEGFTLSQPRPAPGRPAGPRAPLDFSLDPRLLEGRTSPDRTVQVRGAQVGPDWSNAFRRWLDQNLRYPQRAIQDGDSGTVQVRITANPDGTVRQVRLLSPSASPALNSGTTMPFAGARLPAFPPGSDPNGVEVDLTVNYILLRR
ncbi:energy transducer TonB [Rhodovarius sp.]|uniref:energy transducer TonB n=2 Tax=Rhodovarius sp. TaxID=2972673 RepID=UPI00333EE494